MLAYYMSFLIEFLVQLPFKNDKRKKMIKVAKYVKLKH